MSRRDEIELFWRAFRYVGNEFAPDEVPEFEQQLADDQAAREAVAEVVKLSQFILAAKPELAPPREAAAQEFIRPAIRGQWWMQPVGWIAVGAAACLAVVMAYQSTVLISVPVSGSVQMVSFVPGSASDLALAWAIARADLSGQDDANSSIRGGGIAAHPITDDTLRASTAPPENVSAESIASDEPSGSDPMEEFTDPVAPAWLLVAVGDARPGAAQEN